MDNTMCPFSDAGFIALYSFENKIPTNLYLIF